MNIDVKLVDSNDLTKVIDFMTDESFNLFLNLYISEEKREFYLKHYKTVKQKYNDTYHNHLQSGGKFYAAYSDDKIVGVGFITKENYLDSLFVLKEYQNKGIGSKILKLIVKKEIKEGAITITARNEYLDLYKKAGFRINGTTRSEIYTKMIYDENTNEIDNLNR